jgi:hypothetical protein
LRLAISRRLNAARARVRSWGRAAFMRVGDAWDYARDFAICSYRGDA